LRRLLDEHCIGKTKKVRPQDLAREQHRDKGIPYRQQKQHRHDKRDYTNGSLHFFM